MRLVVKATPHTDVQSDRRRILCGVQYVTEKMGIKAQMKRTTLVSMKNTAVEACIELT